jgi:hypothetical protein
MEVGLFYHSARAGIASVVVGVILWAAAEVGMMTQRDPLGLDHLLKSCAKALRRKSWITEMLKDACLNRASGDDHGQMSTVSERAR